MRRSALGIIAVFLLVVGGVSAFQGEQAQQFSGVCVKSGLVLGALWLALPQITATLARAPRWLLSWFVGKRKDANRNQPSTPEVPRPPRPRRRSNR